MTHVCSLTNVTPAHDDPRYRRAGIRPRVVTVGDMTATEVPARAPALLRMRRYTTASLVAVMGTFTVVIALAAPQWWFSAALIGVGGIACWYTAYWESPAPGWLTVVALILTSALWVVAIVVRVGAYPALLLFVVAFVPISRRRRRRLAASALAIALVLLPVGIAAIVRPDLPWTGLAVGTALLGAAAAALFFLNGYAWGLYLEIDNARQLSSDLAVAQERYRFAADLHDIQGHTLHVLRLKTRLAAKLLEGDPAAAAQHLREADDLIAETLANTRTLAFGERRVALASELANARALFDAAGIRCTVSGSTAPGPHDDLFGLVVRESTTNILRHAQPTTVTITLSPGRLTVANDGSPATRRAASGLARLGERFAGIGGTLRTSVRDGVFTTEAAAG